MYGAQALHQQELVFIRAVQEWIGQGGIIPMKAISLLGSEAFIIAALPFIYWCVDRKRGARLGLLVMASAFINFWFKELLAWPRPFNLDPSLGLAYEATFGMPSGHSQLSLIFWVFIAEFLPAAIRWPIVLFIPLLVGFSRIYLGVHFPSDVLGGYLAGAIILLLYRLLFDPLEKAIKTWDFRMRIVLAVAAAFIMNLLLPGDTSMSGAFFGSAVGFAFCARDFPFSENDARNVRIIRYVLGLASTVALYAGLKLADTALNAATGASQARLVRFIRYALVGGWTSLGAPLMFLKLGLAKKESPSRKADNPC